jgi:drug/metabolite transporter (DMT)-like permease
LPLSDSNPAPTSSSRRWTIVAAGLLLVALALVVIYTTRGAFFNPLALVVVAAIGLAALLLQLRLRREAHVSVSAPVWLNMLAIAFAAGAVVADVLRFRAVFLLAAALGAVLCFATSGVVVLNALRKTKPDVS